MHILILSWRDIKNPLSGGAESFLYELSKRLINKGHSVTLYTSNFKNGKSYENLNGVKIYRQGNQWTVHYNAFRRYQRQPPNTFNLIIDNFHALPFFTPLYAKQPIISVIHEITRELWFVETLFPISLIGYLIEPLFFLPYRNQHFLVASPSTQTSLIKLGHPKDKITTFFQGIDLKPLNKLPKKADYPLILCLSRLSPTKRFEHAIQAMKYITEKIPAAQLRIAGSGKPQYLSKLNAQINKLKLTNNIKLVGHVSGKAKEKLLKKSWIILGTSIREGWGLAITEAAAFATPAVAYDVPGFKDSVIHNKTGILVNKQKPKDLAKATINLIKNTKQRNILSLNCLQSVKNRTREQTAKQLLPLFKNITGHSKTKKKRKLNILITSWRDIKSPAAGGAEILTHEIAKRLVRLGHKVTILAPIFPGALNMEKINGINILRPSFFFATRPITYLNWPRFLINAAATYRTQLSKQTDIVIDQVHGLPSFTPLFVNKPVIMFPLEVASEIWLTEIPFPGNILGWLVERIYLFLFRKLPFITISASTAKDLKAQGVKKVKVITPGIPQPPKNLSQKTKNPTFICLGRLTKMKRLKDSIQAFVILKSKHPQAKLIIVGKGSHIHELKSFIKQLKLTKAVTFHGFVSENKKYRLLSQSWALLSTSIREGWGLNVIEAASVATPTIAYKIPGIVDTVVDHKTGLLTNQNTPSALAEKMIDIVENQKLRLYLSKNAKIHAQQFSWEKTTNQFIKIINQIVFKQ